MPPTAEPRALTVTARHVLRVPSWPRFARGPIALSVALAAVGALVWLLVFPRVGTDLSAAITRAEWAQRYPADPYILSWYGGVYPASYSLLAPYVLAAAGTRLVMAVAAVAGAGAMTTVAVRHRVEHQRTVAVFAAIGMLSQLSAGRAPFCLGVAAAIGCIVVADSQPPRGAARRLAITGLALLASALSPVAGLFLGVPAAALVLTGRRALGLAIGLASAVPLAVLALLPGSGPQPLGVQNWLPALTACAIVLVCVPRRWRVVRTSAIIYGLGVVTVVMLPTPVGSNIERLGELVAGPVVAALATAWGRLPQVAAVAAAAVWLLAQPAQDLSIGNAPPYQPRTAALVRELAHLHADTARVEAVPQYGHWESQELAGVVWLARGWERQVDMTLNPLFYNGALTPRTYHTWLRDNAVRYVAISSGRLDWSAGAEAALIDSSQPWLVPVWHNAFWRLYRVAGSLPLAAAPATVVATTPAALTLRMPRAGATLVRIRWSPLLRAVGIDGSGSARLVPRGKWTRLTVTRPGVYRLSATY